MLLFLSFAPVMRILLMFSLSQCHISTTQSHLCHIVLVFRFGAPFLQDFVVSFLFVLRSRCFSSLFHPTFQSVQIPLFTNYHLSSSNDAVALTFLIPISASLFVDVCSFHFRFSMLPLSIRLLL